MQSSTKILTPAREAVMAALKGWEPWTRRPETFTDGDGAIAFLSQLEPQLSRCPLVAASWQPFTPIWEVHLMQRWASALFVSVWVPNRETSLSEALAEDIIDAVFSFPHPNSTNAAPVGLVQKQCGVHPEILGMEVAQPEQRGEAPHRLIRSSVAFNLRLQKDPIRRASA